MGHGHNNIHWRSPRIERLEGGGGQATDLLRLDCSAKTNIEIHEAGLETLAASTCQPQTGDWSNTSHPLGIRRHTLAGYR